VREGIGGRGVFECVVIRFLSVAIILLLTWYQFLFDSFFFCKVGCGSIEL